MADKARVYKRRRTWYVDVVEDATLKDVHLAYMTELRAYAKKPASIRQAECPWRHITRILGEPFSANDLDDVAPRQVNRRSAQ